MASAGLDPNDALDTTEEGWALVGRGEDAGLRLYVGFRRGQALVVVGRLLDAYHHVCRLTEHPPEDMALGSEFNDGESPFAALLLLEGWLIARLGDPAGGLARLQEGIELAARRGDPRVAQHGALYAALACSYLGDPAGTMSWAEQCRAAAESHGLEAAWRFLYYVPEANVALWEGYVLARNWLEATRAAERIVEPEERPPPWIRANLAYAQARLGSGQQARELAIEVLEERSGGPPSQSPTLATTGVAPGTHWLWAAKALTYAAGAAERERIAAALDLAGEWIETSGCKSELPYLHEARADLASVCGDEAACERERREAERLWTAMGAHGHIERMTRDLAELRTTWRTTS